MQCEVQNKLEDPVGDVNALYVSDEKEVGDGNVSTNKLNMQMTKKGTKIMLCMYGQTI